jgi:hypothetical protein
MEMNPGNDSRRPELPSRPSSTRRRRSFGLKKTKQSEAKRLVIDRGPRRNVRLTIDPVCPAGHLPPPGIYLELRFRKTPKRPYHASADPSRQGGRSLARLVIDARLTWKAFIIEFSNKNRQAEAISSGVVNRRGNMLYPSTASLKY